MKFLSDILAKAGLTVDGVVTLNNTATGQTPDANDNSTKLATTAWVRTFVQPYSLPIATASVLGGIKVGEGLSINASTGVLSTVGGASITSFRSEYIITATAGQTTFTVPNGYTPGKIDLFLNGVYLNDTIYTATNSSTIVLDDAAALDDILTVFVYSTYYVGESPSARTTTYFTATSNQTVFTVDYVIGQVDIFYNGSKLEPSEYTANNGTSITLLTPATTGDKIEVVNWAVGGGIAATRTITIDGVAQDLTANRTWNILPTGGAAGDILAKTSATNYDVAWIPNFTSTVQHTVKAAVALTAGQAVYVSSADGTNMIVSKASNASEQTSSKTLGLVAQNLAINGQGFVVTEGLLAGLDTTGANAAGDPVWLGTDGNLLYGLANKPYAPAHLVFIGVVTRINANNGEIFVKVQNGFEFDELHDLSVKDASDGDMIKYVASTGLWTKIAATTTNITEGTNLYYTNTRSRTAISLTTSGTSGAATYDNATGVINIPQYQGGVTSFNTRTGAITLSSSDVTTALTYTPVTNARTLTINGTTYDLSADRSWSIASGVTSFNTRTGAISLTSLDVTDALTYTPVTNARTLTINGTSYDLSANRSWTIAPDVSVRNTYAFTATAAQTTFTVSGGYTVGLVDVFINGVKLAAADFTATNGTTVVLATGTGVGNIVEIIKYVSAFTTAQEALNGTGLVRMSGTTVSYDNATYATQSYVTTAVANLVDAAPSTLDTLNELAAALGDDPNFATTIATSIGTKLPSSSVSGTTNYLPKFTGTSTIGNSVIQESSSLIGINVTPTRVLHLSSSGTNAAIRLDNTASGRPFLLTYDDSQNLTFINSSDSGYIAFNSGTGTSTTKMLLTNSGNLGLGVTPSSWNANSRALQLPSFVSLSQQNNGALNLMSYAVETSGNAFTHGETGTYPARLNMNPNDGTITLFGAGTGSIGGNITWASRLAFTSTGAATFSSSVTANQFISNATNVGDEYYFFKGNAVVNNNFSIYAYTNFLYLNAYSSINIRANNTGGSGGTINLTGGNVGIGTSPNASFILDMTSTKASGASGMRLTTQSSSAGPIIVLNYTGSSLTNWGIGAHQQISGALEFASSNAAGGDPSIAGTTRLLINSGGDVGINIVNPSEKLHLYDSSRGFVGLRLQGSTAYAGSDWTIYSSSVSPNSADDFLGFYNNSTTDSATSEYKFRLFKTGLALFTNTVSASSFSSVSTSASIPFTTWTTIYNTDAYLGGIYIVQVGLNGGSSDDWSASAIYFSGASTDMRYLVGPVNGNLVQLRKTGNSIQVYQNGTSPSITLTVRVLKVS